MTPLLFINSLGNESKLDLKIKVLLILQGDRGDHTIKQRRFWKQDSKKLDCTAIIQMKEVIKFPEYKVYY